MNLHLMEQSVIIFTAVRKPLPVFSGISDEASLRETTLEDVFVERAGKHLSPS